MGLLQSMGVIAVENVDGGFLLTAYPNPVTDNLLIEVDEQLIGTQLTIVDLNGRNVIQLTPSAARSIFDVSHINSGIYFLKSSLFNDVVRLVIQ